MMIKPIGPACNLDCDYCYYKYKEYLYPNKNTKMELSILEEFTKQYIQSRSHGEVVFGWQGGEPTMLGIDYFKRALEFQEKYKTPHMVITNAFQTNGMLITEEWAEFFAANKFLVGLSMDGPETANLYRKNLQGEPVFTQLKKAVALLRQYEVEFNILCCVHAGNQNHPLDVYRFFRDELGVEFIQFIPIVEQKRVQRPKKKVFPHLASARSKKLKKSQGGKWAKVQSQTPANYEINRRKCDFEHSPSAMPFSVDPQKYGEFLWAVFKEWVHNDVGKIFVQIFDVTLASWMGQFGALCCFSPRCGNALVIEHNGDVYACDHFVDPNYYLGNITEFSLVKMVKSAFQRQFGLAKTKSLPSVCHDCRVRFACNGGCPKNRFITTKNQESGLNYLCPGYKYFFTKITPYMNFMANELKNQRPAANIMEYLKDNPIDN